MPRGHAVLESFGPLLRAWRLDRGWTQAEVADAVGVSSAAVSTWEIGIHRPSLELVEGLDDAFDADGCLADMVRALGTPDAFSTPDESGRLRRRPRRYWGSSLAGSEPMWAWVRPAEGEVVRALGWAGPFGLAADEVTGPEGLFMVVPQVHLDRGWHIMLEEPGWVDFGRGTPPQWLEQPVVSVDDLADLRLVNPADRMFRILADGLRRRDRGDPATLTGRLRALAGPKEWDAIVESSRQLTADAPLPEVVRRLRQEPRPPATPAERRTLQRQLREARGLSQLDAADAVTRLLGPLARRVTSYQVHRYEAGRASRVRYLPALLDVVYSGDGWTCAEPVPVRRTASGRFIAAIPPFWAGALSVTVTPAIHHPTGGRVLFGWNHWRLERELPAEATTFGFRVLPGTGPLRMEVPDGWRIQVVLGQDVDAIDADADWVPAGADAAREAWDRYIASGLQIAGRTRSDLLTLSINPSFD